MMDFAEAIKVLAEGVKEEIVVTHIGTTAHEWEYHAKGGISLIGSGAMGMTTSIALGLALGLPHRKVIAIDGDGGLLMNLGSLATIAHQNPPNLLILVFQNDLYESSGGQPLVNANKVDFAQIAKGAGIREAHTFDNLDDWKSKVDELLKAKGPALACLKVGRGEGLPLRKDRDYLAMKLNFREAIARSEKGG